MHEKVTMPPLHSRHLRVTRAVCALVVSASMFHAPARAADALVDPTRPISAGAESAVVRHPGEVRVEAILDRVGYRVAIVDGKVVRVGDRFSWGQVEEITPTGIRFASDGRSRFVQLEIQKVQVRRPSASREAAQ